MRAFQLPAISLILHTLDFNVYAVADLAPVTVTCSQQLARLFGSLGLDAPFFHTRDMHAQQQSWGAPRRIMCGLDSSPGRAGEQIGNPIGFRDKVSSILDSKRDSFHIA